MLGSYVQGNVHDAQAGLSRLLEPVERGEEGMPPELVAQANEARLVLASSERTLDAYGVAPVWI